MKTRSYPDPFAPLEVVVTVVLYLLLASLALFVVIAGIELVRTGETSVSVASIGGDDACVLTSNETVPHSTDVPQHDVRRDTARAHAEMIEVCLEQPTVTQRVAASLGPIGELLLAIGASLLIRRIVQIGRRQGLFSADMTADVRHLGWFLLAMALLWPFAAAAGEGIVLDAALKRYSWSESQWFPAFSVTLVVVAVGVVSVARLLRWAVLLREDVEATI